MYLETVAEGKEPVVALTGGVDFEEVEELRSLLDRYVAEGNTVSLDLSGCDYLCSMAIGVILGFKIESRLRGGDMWVTNANEKVKELFEIVGGSERVIKSSPETETF